MSWRLLQQWMHGCQPVRVEDPASVSMVRQLVRSEGAHLGTSRLERLVTAASELAHNQLRHARDGLIGVRAVQRMGVPGLEVIAADRGPGLSDTAVALSGRTRGSGGLGFGLSSAYSLVDEMDLDVRRHEGTCVRARTFLRPVPRYEFATWARSCDGESISGDNAACVLEDAAFRVLVVDGAGHGVLAREVADEAVDEFLNSPGLPAHEFVVACDGRLRGTRGASLTVVNVFAAEMQHCAVGDISTRVFAGEAAERLPHGPGLVGKRPRKVNVHSLALAAPALVLLATDGLSSRLEATPDELQLPALMLAERMVSRFGRPHDDALVAVLRLG